MKKLLYLSLVMLVFLVLAACSTAAQANPETTSPSEVGAEGTSAMQLALGTFVLEDTEYAITAEQATELLPLWKAAQSLSESDTITAEEFQAVFNQIEDSLSPEQMNFITTMELDQETMTAISEKYGLTFVLGGGGGFDPENLSPEQQATIEAFQESGQAPGGGGGFGPPDGGEFPGGAPPDGGFSGGGPGGGFPGGGDIGSLPETQQTAIASGAGRTGGAGGLPPAFYEGIIEFLEAKVQ